MPRGADAAPTAQLMALIRGELVSVPVDAWGFFFPCHVAVWRFVERMRPGVLGPLKARFAGEPVFEGKGAAWFCEELGADDEFIGLLEAIMVPITHQAAPGVREAVVRRGFFLDPEIPPIDVALVERLSDVVLAAVDRAVSAARIT